MWVLLIQPLGTCQATEEAIYAARDAFSRDTDRAGALAGDAVKDAARKRSASGELLLATATANVAGIVAAAGGKAAAGAAAAELTGVTGEATATLGATGIGKKDAKT